MRKRILSTILVMIMVFNIFGTTAFADEVTEENPVNQEEGEVTEDNPVNQEESEVAEDYSVDGNMTVDTTDSFGDMIASDIDTEYQEQEENEGCNIFAVEMNGNQATVELESNKNAVVVVGIYTEDGIGMIASGSSDIEAGATITEVTINIAEMPAYFYLRSFLVDADTLKPYCTSYESPNYTQEMQEFLSKTTEDFLGQEIVNFDEDNTNNFAVYDENTVVLSHTEGTNTIVSEDDASQTYVFENADEQMMALQAGEIFSYEKEDGTLLIVRVAAISIDGTTVTITGEETTLEEVFDYVKLDTEASTSEAQIDPSTCDEGVTYEGLIDEELQSQAIADVDITDTKSASLTLDKKIENDVTISGKLGLKLKNSLKLYLSLSYQYLEIKIDYAVSTEVYILEKTEKLSIPLVTITFSPVAGVSIEVTPSFVIQVSAKVTLSGELAGCIGFSASNKEGMNNLTKGPSFKSKVEGEIFAFIGVALKPKIAIISDKLAKAEAEGTLGVEISGKTKINNSNSESEKHECATCIDGDISLKVLVWFRARLLDWDALNWELRNEKKAQICDFYWSTDYEEFGFTTCPHMLYKLTVTVKDKNGTPIKDALVNYECKTDKNGKASLYLANGTYIIMVSKNDGEQTNKKVTIKDAGKSVGVVLDQSGGAHFGEGKIDIGGHSSGVIKDDGSLWMWGSNYYGQLGDGTKEAQGQPVKIMAEVKEISIGGTHSGAIKEDGSLWMWGSNYYGQLGDGTKVDKSQPVKIMNDVKEISLGRNYSAAIKKDGSLWMWGSNDYGELGDGTKVDKSRPVKIMDDVKEISLGGAHSGAIKTDGSLWIWGENDYGELGDGTKVAKSQPVKIMDNVKVVSLGTSHSAAIKEDGSLWMWGSNYYGQLGDGTKVDKSQPVKIMDDVNEISLGSAHCGAIKEDGSLWMWGRNDFGQLGDGANENKNQPVKIVDDVRVVSLGLFHSGAIKVDGSLWMWGSNDYGQLGDGTYDDKSVPTTINANFIDISTQELQTSETEFTVPSETELRISETFATEVTQSEDGQSQVATFANLVPGETYNFYVMKSQEAESLLASDNLLYIQQSLAAEDGSLSITYRPTEVTEGTQVFVVRKGGTDIAGAEVNQSNLTYTGEEQYIAPIVTYQGQPLTEGIDYELIGDYCGTESGTYMAGINGIGNYVGNLPFTYDITKEQVVLPYTDVHEGDWYYEAVKFAYENGTMTGMDATSFAPANNLARAQFATILYRMEGSPAVEYTNTFPDVPDGQFYSKPVIWANQQGIVGGYSNGYFGPGDSINREQIAVMMYRYAKSKGYDVSAYNDLNGFPDKSSVNAFATEAMQWAVGAELISGTGAGTQKRIEPQGNAVRAQCATIVMRFMNKYEK